MSRRVKFARGTVNKDALCGDFEIKGKIPWEQTDTNGRETCQDPLVELFIAIRNQYRNVIAISLLPPTREGDVIEGHLLPSCVAHYTGDLPEKFEQVVRTIYVDLCTAIEVWNKKWAEMYEVYYNISEYKLCDEVTREFIQSLGLPKAPAINRSMILDIVEQFELADKEEVLKLFNASEERTLALLQ